MTLFAGNKLKRPSKRQVLAVAYAAWGLSQPLLVAVEALAFFSGVYSLLISLAGFAVGFSFPRGLGV